MNRKMIILTFVAIALVTLACSININLPITRVKTGPTVTDNINVPLLPSSQTVADVTLKFGAGTLDLQPGTENALISGTATYNVADFKPTVTIDNDNINIEQGNLDINGIPDFRGNIVNDWNLSLGNAPISLVINAGAYMGKFELGGLSIQRLEVADGASNVEVSFSEPNRIEMSSLQYTTGASEVTLTGLANANLNDMIFRSGAGNYTLDFTGELTRDMTVTIESGVSSVTVIIPQGVAAEVITQSGLMNVSTSGSWEQHGDTYQLSGSGHTITINVKMGAGSLHLETK
jgi:hypothetical protein